MKKLQLLMSIILISGILASCHIHRRKTIISSNSNNHSQTVEYTGWISFNTEKTDIQSMSPHAYFKYSHDDEELKANSDSKGHIIYELGNGNKTTLLNNQDKQLLAEAIKFVTSQKHLNQNNGRY